MFQEEFQAVCSAGKKKISFLQNNFWGYVVASLVAGMFISFGSFVTFVMGTPLKEAGDPMMKLVMAFCFASALSLVISAGSELFTGNNFVMAASAFSKTVAWKDAAKVWGVSYIGNFVGSWLCVLVFQLTGVPSGAVGENFAATAATKMAIPPVQMFTRAVFCNILVCLAVWCSVKLKNEAARLIMVFWCILIFMVCGFEHSVANMSIMGVGLLNAGDAAVSVGGYFYNIIIVSLGNLVGGAIFVALPYYLISKENKK